MKNLFLASLLLLFATLATGQGGQLRDQAIYGGGVPNASVLVCQWSASPTIPCSPTVTIYSDRDLAAGHAIQNPTTADGAGNYIAYVPPGLYTVQISSSLTSTLSQSVMIPVAVDGTGKIPGSLITTSSVLPTPVRAGDIIYWNGSAWVTLAGNNSGTVCLQEDSSGVPSWQSCGGGGGITGSGTAGRLMKWFDSSTATNAAFYYEDSSNAYICETTFPCTGPYILVNAHSASGGMTLKSPSGAIVINGGAATGIALNVPGGNMSLEATSGVQPTMEFKGGSSGSVFLTVSATNSNQTINLNNLAQTCGTTTTCSGSRPSNPRMLWGRVTLSGGTATVSSISPAFASTSSSECVAQDRTTASNAANAVIASTTSITVTGTGTDVIAYVCTGN